MATKRKLASLAYARSGDKGSHANIGVMAKSIEDYHFLLENLTAQSVKQYFIHLPLKAVERYELPNLLAFNFMLYGILDGGGSLSLKADSQGKALGQVLMQMEL